jgi:GcrA cell cycle regulator
MTPPPIWTDDEIAALTAMWTRGATAREISKRLNRSRNAVIGKAKRLGINQPVKPEPIIVVVPPAPKPPPPPRAPKAEHYVPFASLGPRSCYYPVGKHRDEPPDGFCGDPTHKHLPYCERHAKIAYTQIGTPR